MSVKGHARGLELFILLLPELMDSCPYSISSCLTLETISHSEGVGKSIGCIKVFAGTEQCADGYLSSLLLAKRER